MFDVGRGGQGAQHVAQPQIRLEAVGLGGFEQRVDERLRVNYPRFHSCGTRRACMARRMTPLHQRLTTELATPLLPAASVASSETV